MKSYLSALALGAALAVTASAAGPALAADSTMKMASPKGMLTIPLGALNGSGESGTAALKDTPAGLWVALTLKGFPAGAQPAHIHKGTCAKLDPKPEYPLSSVVSGKSTTTIKGLTIAKLLASPSAINVHKSTTEIATYVSCGNIAMMKHGAM
jgi:hypothetical protein